MPRDPERRREYQRGWYARNRQVFIDKNERRRDINREFIMRYLGEHPCEDCGEDDAVVLEFDHVRGVKKADVSFLVKGGYSRATIEEEIAKCEVVCANCHRRRTFSRSDSHRTRPPVRSGV